jgi:hypothetical protein
VTTTEPDHDRIAATAFQLWIDAGRPEGRADEHWFNAIAALKMQAVPEAPAAPAKAKAAAKPRAKKAAPAN